MPSEDHAGPGPLRIEQPGSLPQRDHPLVGSQRASRRSPAVELHSRVPVAGEQRADGRVRRPARHPSGGRHAVLPEDNWSTADRFPARISAGNPDSSQRRSTQISGTCSCANQKYNACRPRCASASAWASNTSSLIPGPRACRIRSATTARAARRAASRHTCRTSTTASASGARHISTISTPYRVVRVSSCLSARSKQFGAHWNRAVDGVLGGWQMGGILHAHTPASR